MRILTLNSFDFLETPRRCSPRTSPSTFAGESHALAPSSFTRRTLGRFIDILGMQETWEGGGAADLQGGSEVAREEACEWRVASQRRSPEADLLERLLNTSYSQDLSALTSARERLREQENFPKRRILSAEVNNRPSQLSPSFPGTHSAAEGVPNPLPNPKPRSAHHKPPGGATIRAHLTLPPPPQPRDH